MSKLSNNGVEFSNKQEQDTKHKQDYREISNALI